MLVDVKSPLNTQSMHNTNTPKHQKAHISHVLSLEIRLKAPVRPFHVKVSRSVVEVRAASAMLG